MDFNKARGSESAQRAKVVIDKFSIMNNLKQSFEKVTLVSDYDQNGEKTVFNFIIAGENPDFVRNGLHIVACFAIYPHIDNYDNSVTFYGNIQVSLGRAERNDIADKFNPLLTVLNDNVKKMGKTNCLAYNYLSPQYMGFESNNYNECFVGLGTGFRVPGNASLLLEPLMFQLENLFSENAYPVLIKTMLKLKPIDMSKMKWQPVVVLNAK